MNDPHNEHHSREAQEGVAATRQIAIVMAAFTANLEDRGYSRAEAIKLTGDYLRAMVSHFKDA